MANLLKPSVDQIVFGHSPRTEPVSRRSNARFDGRFNAGFLAQDDAAEPVANRVAELVRRLGTAVVLVTGLATLGRI